ncbi:MAG TPA: amidase family protein [Syntrophales bacterium]|nr:amidase family protein [Syntrophales bacterium]HOS77492.1 amidase family protein [Syntrophales bacterium]HPB70620.1 amidase family protein [Syntrophales bacterium]HQN26146.1 amidase family protein [Syntrophales bacterium]HQP28503.1 amidase family protein [Syntrophales bacterium]
MDSIFFYRPPEAAVPADGPLKGMNIAIQPNVSAAGWPTDAGSNALARFVALEDATVVERLRQAGASICGSTRMSEFGFGLDGSRAGEAIKRNAAHAELVLDLMGESRLAASAGDVCGFKPSYGLVSRFGLIGLIPSMECYGILSDSLKNIREILKAIAGPDERDFSLPDETTPDFSPQNIDTGKTTVGIIKEAPGSLPARQESLYRAAIETLGDAGLTVKELSLPDFPLFLPVHKIVGAVEASSCTGRYDSVRYGVRVPGAKNWNEMYLSSRGAAFGPLLKSYLFQGTFFQFERYDAYEDACRIRARLVAGMRRLAAQADFWAIPVERGGPDAPASLADTYAQFALTAYANVAGLPALYLPPAQGRPHPGVQLSGPRLSDARLLALGEHLLNARRGGNA